MRLADPFKNLLHCHKNVSGHLKKRQKTSHNKVAQAAYNAGENGKRGARRGRGGFLSLINDRLLHRDSPESHWYLNNDHNQKRSLLKHGEFLACGVACAHGRALLQASTS